MLERGKLDRGIVEMVDTESLVPKELRVRKEESEFFHFHFASLLRFMAANLSFTQFVT